MDSHVPYIDEIHSYIECWTFMCDTFRAGCSLVYATNNGVSSSSSLQHLELDAIISRKRVSRTRVATHRPLIQWSNEYITAMDMQDNSNKSNLYFVRFWTRFIWDITIHV